MQRHYSPLHDYDDDDDDDDDDLMLLVSDKKDIWPVKNLCQLFAEVLSC